VRGKNPILTPGKTSTFAGIRDGTSNTIMAVEAADDRAVVWTKPDDFDPDEDKPIKGLVELRGQGFLVLFGDGSVKLLSESIKPDTLRALMTASGGEVVELP